jgi:hypothetical protein
MSETQIQVRTGQKRLAVAWVTGSVLAFVILLVETTGPQSPLESEFAWQWFMPLVIPTCSLMLSTLLFQGRDATGATVTVDRSVFKVSMILSVAFLFVIVLLLAIWPIFRLRTNEVQPYIAKTKWWLPSLQGLVNIGLGAFFVSRTDRK